MSWTPHVPTAGSSRQSPPNHMPAPPAACWLGPAPSSLCSHPPPGCPRRSSFAGGGDKSEEGSQEDRTSRVQSACGAGDHWRERAPSGARSWVTPGKPSTTPTPSSCPCVHHGRPPGLPGRRGWGEKHGSAADGSRGRLTGWGPQREGPSRGVRVGRAARGLLRSRQRARPPIRQGLLGPRASQLPSALQASPEEKALALVLPSTLRCFGCVQNPSVRVTPSGSRWQPCSLALSPESSLEAGTPSDLGPWL